MSLSQRTDSDSDIYYWHSIIDPRGILSAFYPEIIQEFKQGSGQLKSLGLDKKQSPVDGIYTIKKSAKARLLFWEYTDTYGRNHLVFFADAPEHDYHKTLLAKAAALKKSIAHQKKIYDAYFLSHPPLENEASDAVVLPLGARKNKVIVLGAEQLENRYFPYPLLYNGPPGSGKTIFIIEKMLDYLYINTQKKLPLLVYTKSRRLLNSIKNELEVSPEAVFYSYDIVFCTPKDLRQQLNLPLTLAGQEHFDQWYNSIHLPKINTQCKNKERAKYDFLNKKKDGHREKIYKELMLIAPYSKKDHMELGSKNCAFSDVQHQAWLGETCQAFTIFLDEKKLYHPGFSSLGKGQYFSAGFMDETPNCRLKEITEVAALCGWEIVLVQDNRQDELDTSYSKLYHIKNLARLNEKQLTVCQLNKSHRIPWTFSNTLDELIDIDCILGKGDNDNNQYKNILCAGPEKGGLFWLSSLEEEKCNSEEKKILAYYHKITAAAAFVVVTHPEYVNEAQKKFGNVLVLTITQSKGLEFDYGIGYRLFDLPIYDSASRELEKNPNAVPNYHLPKDREGVNIYRKACRQLLIAMTRWCKSFLMFEPPNPKNPHHAAFLKKRLFEKRTHPDLSIEIVNPSTPEEWKDLIYNMIEVNQIELAKKTARTQLNMDDEEIAKIILSMNDEKSHLAEPPPTVTTTTTTTTTTPTTNTNTKAAATQKMPATSRNKSTKPQGLTLEDLLTANCTPQQWKTVLQGNGFEKLMEIKLSNGLSLFENIHKKGDAKVNEFLAALKTFPDLMRQFTPSKNKDPVLLEALWHSLIEMELHAKKSYVESDQANKVLLENKQIAFVTPTLQSWPILTFLLDNKHENHFFNTQFKQIKDSFKKENLNIVDLIFTANKSVEKLLFEKFGEALCADHILLELFHDKYNCELIKYILNDINRKKYFPASLTIVNLIPFLPETLENKWQQYVLQWFFKNILLKHGRGKTKNDFLQILKENKSPNKHLQMLLAHLSFDDHEIQTLISLVIKHHYDYHYLKLLQEYIPGCIERLAVTNKINLLNEAVENNNTDCLLLLLHHEAPIFSGSYTGKNPIEIAWEKNKKAFAYILRHLITYDDVELLKKLLALNLPSFDISTFTASLGHNALHYACSVNSLIVVKWLAEDYPNLLQGKCHDERLPHQYAITSQHITMLKWLIGKKGCSPSVVNNKNQPLIALLIHENNIEAVQWLIINYKPYDKLFDFTSYCPLLDAIQKGKTDIALLLTTLAKGTFYTFNLAKNKNIYPALKELAFDLLCESLKFIVAGFKSDYQEECNNIFKDRTFTPEEKTKLHRLFEIQIFLGAQTNTMFYAWILIRCYHALEKEKALSLCQKIEAAGYFEQAADLRVLIQPQSVSNSSRLFQPASSSSQNTVQPSARKKGP